MKPRCSRPRNHALTLVEVLVVIAVLVVLAAMLLPSTTGTPTKATTITCRNNLKQIGWAYQIWAGDHNDKYPMEISVTDGGTMELVLTGDVVATFQIMSNELHTAKILWCPTDAGRTIATNFTADFNNGKISYFVGLDADTNHPQAFLSGDANFAISGVPAKSGLLEISTNTQITWTAARHNSSSKNFGIIGLVDGSIQQARSPDLRQWFLPQTGLATNRLALP